MTLFVTSSPYIEGAPGAFLSNNNGFVDRIREVLPENPRALFICSDPDDRGGTCRFAAETTNAFALEGMAFSSYHVRDRFNARQAYHLICSSDLIILCGGHVPTQNAFFHKIHLGELLQRRSCRPWGATRPPPVAGEGREASGSGRRGTKANSRGHSPGTATGGAKRLKSATCLQVATIQPHGRHKK